MPDFNWEDLYREVPPVCRRYPTCEGNGVNWLTDEVPDCTWPACAEQEKVL